MNKKIELVDIVGNMLLPYRNSKEGEAREMEKEISKRFPGSYWSECAKDAVIEENKNNNAENGEPMTFEEAEKLIDNR